MPSIEEIPYAIPDGCGRLRRILRYGALIAAAKDTMEGANLPAVALKVPLTVEAGTGRNWAEAH